MSSVSLWAQPGKKDIIKDNLLFRAAMNKEFADSSTTPLTREGLKNFDGLSFFPVNAKYCVISKLTLTPGEQAFEMPRSKGNTGTYRKYGVAEFMLNGTLCRLSVYQYMKFINDSLYKDDLFLPFKDLTNGRQTYGGGRFLELKIPDGDQLIIDFNKAYNPLCCYGNPKYSCPIPPEENHLKIKILAGEKAYKGK
ncbi:MAG TPA: DUF1684 domain-containing protein [Bacteroidales bacterium]|nr:DUF1684 domain-containing protein [Bacteroidales bacterium]HNZ42737.1 DUF1684 domain-containing protein [Bacteroidales bacterium]HPB25046.1 DUF1684 domain-containing protein [Bacteroidales bacterium]HPI29673.1 DUF1684 domain-containing protein [Bacteroidales bacterium]HQN15364.1 DUF1684 domain-containing protein [Bacteroidales bacterium]